MEGDPSSAARLIRKAVSRSGKMTGAGLANALRSEFPDWDVAQFGVRTLREFVDAYVSGVIVSGRSGMDLIYEETSELPLPETTKQFWKTWVSPFSKYTLAVNASTGEVDQVSRSTAATIPKGWEVLSSPTEESHLNMAGDFLEANAELNDSLRLILLEHKDQWWRKWYSAITKAGKKSEWRTFRESRLEQLLREALQAGIREDAAIERAFADITRTNSSATTVAAENKPQKSAKENLLEAIALLPDEQVATVLEALSTVFAQLQARRR